MLNDLCFVRPPGMYNSMQKVMHENVSLQIRRKMTCKILPYKISLLFAEQDQVWETWFNKIPSHQLNCAVLEIFVDITAHKSHQYHFPKSDHVRHCSMTIMWRICILDASHRCIIAKLAKELALTNFMKANPKQQWSSYLVHPRPSIDRSIDLIVSHLPVQPLTTNRLRFSAGTRHCRTVPNSFSQLLLLLLFALTIVVAMYTWVDIRRPRPIFSCCLSTQPHSLSLQRFSFRLISSITCDLVSRPLTSIVAWLSPSLPSSCQATFHIIFCKVSMDTLTHSLFLFLPSQKIIWNILTVYRMHISLSARAFLPRAWVWKAKHIHSISSSYVSASLAYLTTYR